jgi:dihydrofolate synthase/folylpolyglutamate synthase
MQTLSDFLDAKPLYYDEIDYDRMPRTYEAVKDRLPLPKIIHIVGTNGKGTTGRFIANALCRSGVSVGHYTSPHILRFNERIWLNGENADDALLERAHETLFPLLGEERAGALSYFEYTTLLAVAVFRDCDWVVLEAGLGGEHDATNVFEKTLSVFTPIDRDHQDFLGDSIDAIAATKLRSMGPEALIGVQPHPSVYTLYDKIAAIRKTRHHRVEGVVTAADRRTAHEIAEAQKMPRYLEENLLLAMAALRVLGRGCRAEWFRDAPLFGRLSRVGDNVIVDVGHNALAAEAIRNAIAPKKVVLVYNSYKDKDYRAILQTLKPVLKRVEIIEVEAGRIAERRLLEAALEAEAIPYAGFGTVDPEESYLVFGSFSVVERFMKTYHA